MPEYYSDVLEEELLLSDFVVDEVVEGLLKLSADFVISKSSVRPISWDIHLNEWNQEIPYKKFNAWVFEVFDRYATPEQKDVFANNQKRLEQIGVSLAHQLYYEDGVSRKIEDFHQLGIFRYFSPGYSNAVNDLISRGFAHWLSQYSDREDIPFYREYYLMQMPRLAMKIISTHKAIDEPRTFAFALQKAVMEDPDITIYLSRYNERNEPTPAMYIKDLKDFWDEKSWSLVLEIMRDRKAKLTEKIQAQDIDPDRVKVNIGVAAGLSAARDSQERFNPQNTGMNVVRKKKRGGFNGPDREDGP